MHDHTHESVPTRIRAVQIRRDLRDTVEAITEVFGPDAVNEWLGFRSTPGGLSVVGMETIQGQYVEAQTGEWLVQEAADPSRFYPVAADVFAARYRGL